MGQTVSYIHVQYRASKNGKPGQAMWYMVMVSIEWDTLMTQIFASVQIQHSFITLDLSDYKDSAAMLQEQILIPANSKVTYGRYNIFPGCVSVLLKSDKVELDHIEKFAILIERTR